MGIGSRKRIPESDAIASAMSIQEAFREVSAMVLPSVVEITVKTDNVTEDQEEGEIPWNDFFSDPSEESEGPRISGVMDWVPE